MTCRRVGADELLRTGYATRLAGGHARRRAVSACVDELLAVPPGPSRHDPAMTAAIGRSAPAMAAGWGDADHQRWAFTEDEYRRPPAATSRTSELRARVRRRRSTGLTWTLRTCLQGSFQHGQLDRRH